MKTSPGKNSAKLARSLLRWFDAHGRTLPWRVKGGRHPDPYHVLLSEFMLQQTGVSTVIPYFQKFIRRWPSVKHLSAATLDQVRAMWAGLGYYRRAGFLHECARAIQKTHKGAMPQSEEALLALPGIGAYTAAALAAIAFDQPANVVDGNVERVVARLFAEGGDKQKLRMLAATLVPAKRNSDYAQALMDLGATTCTPRAPGCFRCPWRKDCRAHAMGREEDFPRREIKKAVPQKYAAAYVVEDAKGRVLLRRRKEGGLYAGMWEFPSTPWDTKKPDAIMIRKSAPARLSWMDGSAPVRHVFSHFKLALSLRLGHSRAAFFPEDKEQAEYRWIKPAEFPKLAMPSVMHKVWQAALNAKTVSKNSRDAA
jgi:A/G-specific adenine glycosylase